MEGNTKQENTNPKKLLKVPVGYLSDGLVLQDNLYNFNGTVLLIPAGEIITGEKLKRLLHYETDNKYITTYESSCRIILEGRIKSEKQLQKMHEDEIGYTVLKKKVDQIFQQTRRQLNVDKITAESVTGDVWLKAKEVDTADVFRCIDIIRPVDEALQRHSLNVAFLNSIIGQLLDLPERDIKQLVLAGLLHDIGKVKIPDQILNAPRKLTPEEFAIVKHHPIYSDEMLPADCDEKVRSAVRHHHEKLCGGGYPDNPGQEQISLFARITAISDIYDAMVSRRSYKSSVIAFQVLGLLMEGAFAGIDQELAELFVRHMVRFYKGKTVLMSDDSVGVVAYIPLNDIGHPVILSEQQPKQADETWYCLRTVS